MKCLWRLGLGRRSKFLLTPPAHLCAVTYMTEISFHVTLNNRIHLKSCLQWNGFPSYGAHISQFIRFARCCTRVLDFHSKNLQITSKLLTKGYRYHRLRKTFGKFFGSYFELLSKLGEIWFQEYVSEGISRPFFYGYLVFKLRRIKYEANFVSV